MRTNELIGMGVRSVLFILFLCSPTVSRADDRELKAMMQELLAEVKSLKTRVTALESERESAKPAELERAHDDLDKITSGAAKVNSDEVTSKVASTSDVGSKHENGVLSQTTIGGYASIEAEDFDGSKSTFDQHRFVLNVGSQVTERLKFYSEIEYEHGSSIESEGKGEGELTISDTNGNGVIDADEASSVPVSVEVENGRSGEIELEQVWMQYDLTKNLGLRAGILLVPFGKFNLTHDDDLQNLTDRPLVARRVTPTTWAESGAGFVTNFELGSEATISSELYAVNGLNDDFSAGSGGLRDARGSFESDNNNNKALVGRVALSPALGHEFGLSGYRGAYDSSGNDINAGAFDWDMRFGSLRLLGEGAIFGLDDGVNSSGERAPKSVSGIYAELNYDFWFNGLNQTFLGESFDDPKFIGVFRYNTADIERRGDSADLDEESFAVGLAYRPVSRFVFKNEFQWNTGDLERQDSDGFISSIAIGF